MTAPTVTFSPRHRELLGLLEAICQALELTPTQEARAKSSYEAVGAWLDGGGSPLSTATVYPQGSVALGTTVRPLGRSEFDVDTVCYLPALTPRVPPAAVKGVVGARLRQHLTYAPMLQEKGRCWRLNFAGEFHMDITPSIPGSAQIAGIELVPDKASGEWVVSNPRGYRDWFTHRAELPPPLSQRLSAGGAVKASIQPLPAFGAVKGVLRRTVQLLKRHRELHFFNRDADLAPISILLTTLAAQSYEYCAASRQYDDGMELIIDVIRFMPSFIQVGGTPARSRYVVANPTAPGENFAEKWNADARLAPAFFDWHRKALEDFQRFPQLAGVDQVVGPLKQAFSDGPVDAAVARWRQGIGTAREAGTLAATSGGLGLSMSAGTSMRRNTFFGA